uniref:C2H2-type domain-containing protein n=1 Tax=Anopheles albimanus TaxID=7167 RepID=A0A182F577_ANOAL
MIRHRFGLYDEITTVNGRTVRHCNWIRFLRVSETYGPQVNVVCAKVKGEPIYEIVKPIPSHQELVVYYLPEGPEELFFIRMRNQLYRQTMDSILEDSPLDLSTSLLSRVMLPISPPSGAEDEHKSVSGDDSSISISSGASTGGDRCDGALDLELASIGTGASSLCSKSFPTPGDLKSHMYVHNGSWPFKCHICSRGFSKQTNLKNHLFLHTESNSPPSSLQGGSSASTTTSPTGPTSFEKVDAATAAADRLASFSKHLLFSSYTKQMLSGVG